ncbi:hypothetical protein OPT61_g6673 [Boeremia exigua]|uniref:Uncharacterized protein n=1 Tax=Boeremia exigua TaxID=749465 RepID=A0ACC2I5P9_9PLEO|nr:hypothetical protein OPT61_g6673 [Boeremia exigua]
MLTNGLLLTQKVKLAVKVRIGSLWNGAEAIRTSWTPNPLQAHPTKLVRFNEGMTSRMLYTLRHKAWLLAYVDLCKKQGIDWKQEVTGEFQKFSERAHVSFDTIRNACRTILLDCGVSSPSVPGLTREGTSYIAARNGRIAPDLIQEMNIIRLKWNLEEIPADLPSDEQASGVTTSPLSSASDTVSNELMILSTPEVIPPMALEPLRVEKIPRPYASSEPTSRSEFSKQHTASSALPIGGSALSTLPAGKRKYDQGSTHDNENRKKIRTAENTNTDAVELCLELAYACLDKPLSGPLLERTRRYFSRNPSSFAGDMLKHAQDTESMLDKQHALITRLVGEPEFQVKTVFPKTPSPSSVDNTLASFRQSIVDINGDERDTPAPTLAAAGYLSRCMEDIASGRILPKELVNYIKDFRIYLKSPHAQQAVLGALFCRWVFQSPEPMCEAHYPKALMKLLEAKLMQGETKADGLERVQHADKLVAQEMFADADEKRTITQMRQKDLIRNLTLAAKLLLPSPHNLPDANVLQKLAADALSLKRALMLSPKDYRIHYCRPEVTFDLSWMQANSLEILDLEDRVVVGKPVALCLFPAVFAQEASPFDDGASIQDALVKNKRFFPSPSESKAFDPKHCITKATVLVLM